MDDFLPALIGGLLGGSITVLGWFVTNRQINRRIEREFALRESEQDRQRRSRFLERQIEELYGPLLGLVRYSKNVYAVATTILPSKDDPEVAGERQTDTDGFNADHWNAWHFLTESYFHPVNAKVRELISGKIHLLESSRMPDSFQAFFEHTAHYEARYKLAQDRDVDTIHISGPRYPRAFETDVANTLDTLKKKYDDLR